MNVHGDYSPEARKAAEGKAAAAGVFSAHADVIVAALPDVPAGHLLVAVVDHELEFSGTHHVAQDELVARIPELEARGWAMVFALGTNVDDVRRRAEEMAALARRRAEMITRIQARQR